MKTLVISAAVLFAIIAIPVVVGFLLPKRHVATRSAFIAQPCAEVFKLISGPPVWRSDVSGWKELAPMDGLYAWNETTKNGDTIIYQRVRSEPPRLLVSRIADPSLPYGGTWTFALEETNGGTLLRITEDGEVHNPIFRFMSRFVFGYSSTIEKYLTNVSAHYGQQSEIKH
jgi:hypothetical protein